MDIGGRLGYSDEEAKKGFQEGRNGLLCQMLLLIYEVLDRNQQLAWGKWARGVSPGPQAPHTSGLTGSRALDSSSFPRGLRPRNHADRGRTSSWLERGLVTLQSLLTPVIRRRSPQHLLEPQAQDAGILGFDWTPRTGWSPHA